MPTSKFIVHSESTTFDELSNLVSTHIESSSCSQLSTEDLSLAMGQPCLHVNVDGDPEAIQQLIESWREHGCEVHRADQPVYELDTESESNATEQTEEDDE